MLYRIITEDISKFKTEKTIDLVSKFFRGFTVIKATGFWNGRAEDSLIIEIQTDNKTDVLWLANQIKLQNNQDSILIQEIKSKGTD